MHSIILASDTQKQVWRLLTSWVGRHGRPSRRVPQTEPPFFSVSPARWAPPWPVWYWGAVPLTPLHFSTHPPVSPLSLPASPQKSEHSMSALSVWLISFGETSYTSTSVAAKARFHSSLWPSEVHHWCSGRQIHLLCRLLCRRAFSLLL